MGTNDSIIDQQRLTAQIDWAIILIATILFILAAVAAMALRPEHAASSTAIPAPVYPSSLACSAP